MHRIAETSSDDDQKTQYQYDAVGNRTQLTEHLKQGPETRTYDYNPANQLTKIAIDSPQPPAVSEYQFTYDKNGNRTEELIADATGTDRGQKYEYDTENRLTLAQQFKVNEPVVEAPTPEEPTPSPTVEPSPSPSPCVTNGNGKNNGKDQSDDCNNGTGNDVSPNPSVSPSPSVEPSPSLEPSPSPVVGGPEEPVPVEPTAYDQTAFEYDGNGRRLVATYFSGASDTGKRTEYSYDRLDPVAEHSIWNGQRKNLYRTTMAPVTNQMQPADPLHAQFRPNVQPRQGTDLAFYQDFKSEQDPNGTEYFYHYDGQGNIAATTKHKAQSDHTYRYDEYGGLLPDHSPVNKPDNDGVASAWADPHNAYTLEQKQYDAHHNLYYYGSRYYDPTTGTWLNQDTYRGQTQDPRTLHRYQYNLNSPVNYVDVYGFNEESRSTAEYIVYGGYDKVTGALKYVGITCRDLATRVAEHLRSGDPQKILNYEVLHRAKGFTTAKGSEQTYMDTHKLVKDGGQLVNKINSISPSNPVLDQAKQQAQTAGAVPQSTGLWATVVATATTIGKTAAQVGTSIINAVTGPLMLFVIPESGYNFPYSTNNPQQRA
ncbi:MAG TPA: RHS repeat-associated core domain-containing protein [Patescibacteria group bacterium]